jgi:peptide subunit release factor 1 (eRF1)
VVVLSYGARISYATAVGLSILAVLGVIWVSGTSLRERFEDAQEEKEEKKVKGGNRKHSNGEQDEDDVVNRPQSDTTNDPEPHIDMGSTILKAYSKMKPEQVSQMRDDTRELMETQQQLIQTLSMLGPQVQQGAELMKTFQGMFGGNITDVLKQ